MPRSVPEWIGKTPDTKCPPHVRARIFDAHGGVCHITKRKIQPGDRWELDHIKRLADGGENRESNLAPALAEPHREKTSEESKSGRRADRQRRAHIGAKPAPVRPIQGAPMPVSQKQIDRAKREPKPSLPPRRLYR